VFSNLVLALGGVEGKGVHTIYAMFNTIIVGVIGFYGFYHGYKVRRQGSLGLRAALLLFLLGRRSRCDTARRVWLRAIRA
jgi:hypothetical protein